MNSIDYSFLTTSIIYMDHSAIVITNYPFFANKVKALELLKYLPIIEHIGFNRFLWFDHLFYY